jgi:[protein-PII] uridylyltransferase
VRKLWSAASAPPGLALVAVGGYGRGKLFPFSDVDILILLPAGPSAALTECIEAFIRSLWDAGIDLGHSVRTIEQCAEEAQKDITVATAMLEARLLTGSRSLMQRFDREVRRGIDAPSFVLAKRLEQEQRHARFQDSPYSLEPNLKEAPGGLRDIQVIAWVCQAAGFGRRWSELARQGLVTATEALQLGRVERFLCDTRIRLHLIAGRGEDRVLFDYQTQLATLYGFTDDAGKRASEHFMQRYYRTAKQVTQINTIVLQNVAASVQPGEGSPPRVINERFQSMRDLLDVRDEQVFEREPGAIFESFQLMQRDSSLQGMTARTLRSLWRARKRVDVHFRRAPENRRRFLELLQAERGIVHEFRRMNQYGILGRYLPAFGRIVGQMQHDLFHVYTVDQHILMVVRNLRRFTMVEFSHEYPECSRLMANFERHWVLYVAAIYHDIAKGRGGDHSRLGSIDARRFCRAHQLSDEDTELVEFLVAQHLTMSAVAQKRDLYDPQVIKSFADIVKTERRLAALYLLTVADIRGTSPKVWNAWKGKLLEELYRFTLRHLNHQSTALDRDVEHKQAEALRLLRLYALADSAKDALWAQLDVSYFLRHDPQEIAWQTRTLHSRVNTEQPVVRARLAPIGEGIEAMIYMKDQRDLFARICAYFESIRFNIVDAKIHTTRNGYALDSFYVLSADGQPVYRDLLSLIEFELIEWIKVARPLPTALRGRVSRQLKHFPLEPQVRLMPDELGAKYSLSVTAGDRPGLLLVIAQIFAKYQVNLSAARINTLGERAEDVFVIDGEALSNEKSVVAFESELVESLR